MGSNAWSTSQIDIALELYICKTCVLLEVKRALHVSFCSFQKCVIRSRTDDVRLDFEM